MFEYLRDCWNYLFNPKTSVLLVMAEMDATAAEFKEWDSAREIIEKGIRAFAAEGKFFYCVPSYWRYLFAKGAPGRKHFKELGFRLKEERDRYYTIYWNRRPNAASPSK